MRVELVLPTASAILAACAGDRGPKEIGGAVIGAAAGGLIGSQIGHGTGQLAATAASVSLGAWLGSEVGRSLDEDDRREYATSVVIDGKTQSAHGTTCRVPDGTWRIEN